MTVLSLLVVLTGCASTDWTSRGELEESGVLAAGGTHEECAVIRPDQTLDYSFQASQPIQFDIHYHEGSDVVYPISEKDISAYKGTFQPKKTEKYCLMWSNSQPQPVRLQYRLRLIIKQQ